MTNALFTSLVVLCGGPLLPAEESFADIRERARQMGETLEGKAYEKEFARAFSAPMQKALRDCTENTKPPLTVSMVFVIGADGITQRIIPAPEQRVSACVAMKLDGLKIAPPPKSGWLVLVNITIKE